MAIPATALAGLGILLLLLAVLGYVTLKAMSQGEKEAAVQPAQPRQRAQAGSCMPNGTAKQELCRWLAADLYGLRQCRSIRPAQYCRLSTPFTAAHQAAEPQPQGRRRGAVGRMQANIRRRQAAAAAAAAAGEERDDENSSSSDEEVRHAKSWPARAGLSSTLAPGHSRHLNHFKAWLNGLLVASHTVETSSSWTCRVRLVSLGGREHWSSSQR